jgi:hypothetical protein
LHPSVASASSVRVFEIRLGGCWSSVLQPTERIAGVPDGARNLSSVRKDGELAAGLFD